MGVRGIFFGLGVLVDVFGIVSWLDVLRLQPAAPTAKTLRCTDKSKPAIQVHAHEKDYDEGRFSKSNCRLPVGCGPWVQEAFLFVLDDFVILPNFITVGSKKGRGLSFESL